MIETTCAVVQIADGLVINTIMAVGAATPPDGCVLVEIMAGVQCRIGWILTDGQFVDPMPPVERVPEPAPRPDQASDAAF